MQDYGNAGGTGRLYESQGQTCETLDRDQIGLKRAQNSGKYSIESLIFECFWKPPIGVVLDDSMHPDAVLYGCFD
jgi:hypothetical protein